MNEEKMKRIVRSVLCDGFSVEYGIQLQCVQEVVKGWWKRRVVGYRAFLKWQTVWLMSEVRTTPAEAVRDALEGEWGRLKTES